ncbi:MAG TPA: hypothetical protein VG456_21135 [Candidatus Sulfopaludibacter sp.]|jgi:hypothetical protein|nr:hypothetical protein [Candidatus Sulfopaludibacter sp.]
MTPKKSPFEIRLESVAGPILRATLLNRSAGPLMVLHDRNLQPSEPWLSLAGGKEIPFTDKRSIAKFDTTPYRVLYRKLDAGREMLLEEERFLPADDGASYFFLWGPFVALGLAPGRYNARVRWKSTLTAWVDSETRRHGNWSDIWLGEVTSNPVEIDLPERA